MDLRLWVYRYLTLLNLSQNVDQVAYLSHQSHKPFTLLLVNNKLALA
jgi:hypothetical protein